MEDLLIKSILHYFNGPLKQCMNYPQTFTIECFPGEFTITSNEPTSLISLLGPNEIETQFKTTLEPILLSSIQNKCPEIQFISISTKGLDVVKIKYGIGINSVDLLVFSRIISYLSLKDLHSVSMLSNEYAKYFTDNNLWIELFKKNYGDIPKYIDKNCNYKKLYGGCLIYKENRDKLIPFTSRIFIKLINYPDSFKYIIREFDDSSVINRHNLLQFIINMFDINNLEEKHFIIIKLIINHDSYKIFGNELLYYLIFRSPSIHRELRKNINMKLFDLFLNKATAELLDDKDNTRIVELTRIRLQLSTYNSKHMLLLLLTNVINNHLTTKNQ